VSFDAAWLDLREPADHAARDPGLLAAAAAHLGDGLSVDLGCGTGSTRRAFGERGAAARWCLIDNDPALLDVARDRLERGVELHAGDLGDLAALPLAGARLVTASALLDLMPATWITALAERLAAEGAGFYAALSYDGVMAWEPPLAGDTAVTAAFNAHQRGDKGLGPALGPDAAPAMAAALRARGFRVEIAPSPWRLGPDAVALQETLVEGIAAAAGESGLASAAAWGQARRAASATSLASVGHWDLLALPAGTRAQSKMTSVSRP
jgi:SAM-dependent methyltransferase